MDCTNGIRKCFLREINDSFKTCLMAEINRSTGINFSLAEALRILQEHQDHDQNVNYTTEMILIIVYVFLIISGLATNLVISFVVARKTQITPRNLYIVNLTGSDIILCLICMPFTLVSILQRRWDLGLVMCKLVPTLQGTNIFVSVGTITVIALDRYATIVCGQEGVNTRRRVVTSIVFIWVISALAAAPVFYYQGVVPVSFLGRLVMYEMCVEVWPSQRLKVCYTASILMIQALIPVAVVGSVHMRIASYLRTHTRTQHDERRVQREVERNRRTTLLLSIVAILFALSWLPLSMFSLMADVLYPATDPGKVSPQSLYTVFAICHIIAMSSATSNPVIYGWLNVNIRQEFLQLLQSKCSGPSDEMAKHSPPPVAIVAVSVTTQTVTCGGMHPKDTQTLVSINPTVKPVQDEMLVIHTVV